MDNSKQKAYFAAIAYACIIGFSFLFVKIALESANPIDLLAHRFTISFAAALLLYPFLRKKYRLSFQWRDLIYLVPFSLLYPVLFFAFQVWGLMYTSSSEAGIIQATIPILTMVLAAWFLKERATWIQVLFTILSVSGVMLLFVMKGIDVKHSHMIGYVLILLSALSSSAYSVFARVITRRFHVIELTFVMTFFGFVFFNAVALIRHSVNHTMTQFFSPFTHSSFVWSMLFLGILSSLLTAYLSNYALSHLEAAKVSTFNNLSAFITIGAGVLILHETIDIYHIIGAVLVIGGVIGGNVVKKQNSSHQK
ncbi:DMT family transporter [Bacillus zhangzhouensis]|uniref:DMT family transporter n=1 Tax=Bacillus zhangzhouensis TaxID=1178540 RepID=UPI002813BB68|nr:DMT family transporter [Bacillus zhangzhouensis]MDR0126233.1 DMT family transporter [Bacillus zhangzhouensis]